jgi:hypothetical protein
MYCTTLSLGQDKRDKRDGFSSSWVFSIISEKLMMFHALGDFIILEKLMMLHEFGDFIISEKANNLNTCF